MKCTMCRHTLRCIRCGATALGECSPTTGSHALAGSIQDEIHNRRVCVEVSKGVMRQVLLLSDVEEILASVMCASIPGT